MTIPDSLQTLGPDVFYRCSKLVPSYIDVGDNVNDVTSQVVLIDYVPVCTLMSLRLVNKELRVITEAYIDAWIERKDLMVYGENGISLEVVASEAWKPKLESITQAIFHLDILLGSENIPSTSQSKSSLLISPRALRTSAMRPFRSA